MSNKNTENRRPRILVVDDEESIRYVLRTFLEKNGCDVVTAESGERALELLEGANPDVALLDIVLPGKNGINLLNDIKHRSPDTEVVLITSHGSTKTAIEAIRHGAYDYLQKPFPQLESVWLTVRRALEKRSLALQVRHLVEEQALHPPEIARAIQEVDASRQRGAEQGAEEDEQAEECPVTVGDFEG